MIHFNAIVVCFDITSNNSFNEAIDLYKELLRNTVDNTKVSRYAQIPAAFVGTKLDLTDFAMSDSMAVKRAIKAEDLKLWAS